MQLQTNRLILRPWHINDADALYQYAQNEKVASPAGWLAHTSIEDSKNILQTILIKPNIFAIALKENPNHAIGSIGIMERNPTYMFMAPDDLEIGYWVAQPFWRQGIASESLKEILRYGFEDLNIDTFWCGYYEGNIGSCMVQKNNGFKYHHSNKNVYVEALDVYRTEHFTKLLKEEWKIENQTP